MKVRVLLLIVAAALIPAAAQAQKPAKDSTPAAHAAKKKKAPMRVARLFARDVNRALPMLKSEIGLSVGMDNGVTDLSQSEFNKIKDALILARLDYRDPSRLQGEDDGTFAIRRMNVDYYRVNESSLDMIVQRATPDRHCPLCTPTN